MQLEVSDTEEALNITGDNLSGDEYAERPAVNAYGSPVNVSRIKPRLAVNHSVAGPSSAVVARVVRNHPSFTFIRFKIRICISSDVYF